MNKRDRDRLIKLQGILESVPFSASGTSTTTGVGAIMFEQDMRALRPYLRRVIEGMVLEGTPGLEKGYDYYDPDVYLSMIEGWIEKRKAEGWQNADQFSLESFVRDQKLGVEPWKN